MMKTLQINEKYRWLIGEYEDEFISCQLQEKRSILGWLYYSNSIRKVLVKLDDDVIDTKLGVRVHIYQSYEISPETFKEFLQRIFDYHINTINKRIERQMLISETLNSL